MSEKSAYLMNVILLKLIKVIQMFWSLSELKSLILEWYFVIECEL